MTDSKTIDYKQERENDVNKILQSTCQKKVIVAGPGTGKSFLFEQVIKKKKEEEKNNFLAITFIGKLSDSLADDLAGLAQTMTLHGFARKIVLSNLKGWKYYPKIKDIIEEDLKINNITEFEIGDKNYKERTQYYKTIGDDDVVYYAMKMCESKEEIIPLYDLILIDEFQDFNEIESKFIDLLASKNEILIVGDDDQALYEFKGSSPKHIRDKFDVSNKDFESHTLRFCSRCTEVIINCFHNIVDNFKMNEAKSNRIKKDYICYLPDKKKDSDLNNKIILYKDTKLGFIPFIIKKELQKLILTQKIKSVLIIGEGRSCKKILHNIANKLRFFGFKNVDHDESENKTFILKQNIIEGYKMLSHNEKDTLAWRLLIPELYKNDEWKKNILDNYKNTVDFVNSISDSLKKDPLLDSAVLSKILNKPTSEVNQIAGSSIERLEKNIVVEKKPDRNILIDQLISENKNLERPIANINITVCNILGSKGLGADVVFLVGFDQNKLPSKNEITESEIYQMLVALTRAKKRIYLINTGECKISNFINYIDKSFIEERHE